MLTVVSFFTAFALALGAGNELRAARKARTRAGRLGGFAVGITFLLWAALVAREAVLETVRAALEAQP